MRTSHRAFALSALLAVAAAFVPGTVSADGTRHATHIDVREQDEQTEVRVDFTGPPTYTARLERGGRRLLIDVPRADLKGAPPALTERVGVVGGVLAQTYNTGRSKTTRLFITLLSDAKYAVKVEGNQLVVTLVPAAKTGVLASRAPEKKPDAVKAGATQPAAELRVQDVRFDAGQAGDSVIVELSERPKRYRVLAAGDRRERLIVEGVRLPEPLQRTLDVSAFGGHLTTISSFVDVAGDLVVEVERGPGAPSGRVERRGSALVWRFADASKLPSSVTGVAADGGAARKVRTVHVEDAIGELPVVEGGFDIIERSTDPSEVGAFTPAMAAQQRGRFTGRRIDLDLKEADIHNVLRLLADVGRTNIVTGDDVKGAVTIRMRNVPWDQALDVILQAKNLGMVRQGNMIRVAPLAELEKEREMAIARRKQEVQLAPVETRLIPVSYATAGAMRDRAAEMLSERGSISVDERTNVLIVRDIAGNLNQIEELIRSLDTQTPQVLVEARIVEATSRYLRDVGIQWGGDATFAAATGNPTGLVFPNSVGVVGGASDDATPTAGLSPFNNQVANPNFAVNLPATVGTGQGGAIGLTFGSIDNTINLAVRLSAAEASGMLRILSSPRILTLDNHKARIAQGTLIPFSTISAQGVQTVFQEAKLQLLVTPHVTADGSVSMHVKINRDEPDFNQTSARGDPTILKREAETDLLVMDGHTAVIGGIFTRNTGRNLDQVPFFGDIPILGLLFQRRRASDVRGELVIFLTPRIVNRAEALGR